MKVLVCGGRDYDNYDKVCQVLNDINQTEKITEIIEGGANGADSLGRQWADSKHIWVTTYVARWDKYGMAAGPIRNEDMLRFGQPDLVVAFPGGSGTRHMVTIATKAKVPVIVVEDE